MNLADLSIKRPIFITSIVSLMLIMGGFALKKMPVDLFPDVTFPIIFIQTVYPGASPLDVEKLVSKPVEDELSSLSGLRNLTSNNLEGISVVILEFKLGTDVREAEQNIRNRIGNIRRSLPADIRDPIIRRFDPADQPVISVAVRSDLEAGELYDLVNEQIKPQFERIQDVGLVNIVGGVKKEIHVLVNKQKLQDRSLSMLQVSRRIEDTSKDVPIGKVENNTAESVLRSVGEFTNIESLKKVAVNFIGSDRPVKLDEIADVSMGLQDQKRISRLSGKNALFLEVFKQSGTNTVAVTDNVKKQIEKLNKIYEDKGAKERFTVIRDNSRPIRLNIADVRESILIGILLCIVVVFFFLGSGRSTFITGMALPNSLLGGFVLMYAMGFSINIMTLLALSLAVGLLIDDAIVVRENIFRHLEMGKKPIQAALEGTQEVSMAVIATTMVVIAVFGPIAFLQGIIGQFFKQFGLTVVFTMLISLFDAFTVAPMLSAYMASTAEHHRTGFIGNILNAFDRGQTKLEDFYESTIKYTLRNRLLIIGSSFLLFVASIIVMIVGVPKTFLPPNEFGEFAVSVETPPGTSLKGTRELIDRMEAEILADKTIELSTTTIGSADGEANKAQFYVRLVPQAQRKLNTTQTKQAYRELFDKYSKEATISVSDIDIANSGQKPLNLNLTGENLDVLTEYATRLKERIKKVPGLVDVDTNFRSGKPEFHVVFDRERSESLGVSTVNAGAELRYRTEGAEPAVFRQNGIEYKVKLRLRDEDRDLKAQFQSTSVPNTNFNMIPLSRIATAEDAKGYSQINRQNKNRFINIAANLGTGGNLGNATNEVTQIITKEMPLPAGVEYRFQGQAEDFKDLIENMLLAIFLGIVFIYLVLSSLYESFVTPLTILLALPMAISGAMFGLFFFGKTIDIFSLIGVILLLGVVAKNSILLVDYTVQLIGEGVPRNEALVKASRTRLRPILMTSLALIAGTLPIAIGLTELGSQRQSMGISIIGGVISSTLLTLVVVPAAFGYIDDFRIWSRRMFGRDSSST